MGKPQPPKEPRNGGTPKGFVSKYAARHPNQGAPLEDRKPEPVRELRPFTQKVAPAAVATTKTFTAAASVNPNSIRGFQQGCADEAVAANLMGFSDAYRRRFMGVLRAAIEMKTTGAQLESPDHHADAFADIICRNLLQQTLAFQHNSPDYKRSNAYGFLLTGGRADSTELSAPVKQVVSDFARGYYKDCWPRIEAALQQRDSRAV